MTRNTEDAEPGSWNVRDTELSKTFLDGSLPLPARLDAARIILRLLAKATSDMRDDIVKAIRAQQLDPDLIATLYWGYDDLVPGPELGSYHQIRDVIEPRCPWTYPCPGCGVDQPVASRSALRELKKLARAADGQQWKLNGYFCKPCKTARDAARDDAYREREAAHHRRIRELRTMPYKEYLQSPEWQERRKVRLKAARYACQVCNTKKERLNVHHRTYERRGAELAGDLIVLCESCHHMFHKNGSLAPHDKNDDH